MSDSLASIFGAERAEMLRHDVSEFVDEPAAARSPLVLMATGAIDGYRRVYRSLRRLDGTALTADIWLSAYNDRAPRVRARHHAPGGVLACSTRPGGRSGRR